MSELEGYWGPIVGLALGLRKGQAHSFITLKKKAYNISPTTKIFRPRKIRLTRTDADKNSSYLPLAPR